MWGELMDTATLERLMLDRALGVLPPDTIALLDGYMADHPAEAAKLAGLEQTTHLARQVLNGDPALSLPAFPRARLALAARQHRRLRIAWRISSLAACLVVGVGLGWLVFRSPPADLPSPVVTVVQNEPTVRTGENLEDDFWSRRRLLERATGVKQPRPSPRLIWESPLAVPKVGDST
jgi:hypothetical protein